MKNIFIFVSVLGALAVPLMAKAAPSSCIRDKDGRAQLLHTCHVKCLAVTTSDVKETPWEITGRCTTKDFDAPAPVGVPGFVGHGTSCVPRKDIKFVTPCDIMKDLNDFE
jgi:hypothetical protein